MHSVHVSTFLAGCCLLLPFAEAIPAPVPIPESQTGSLPVVGRLSGSLRNYMDNTVNQLLNPQPARTPKSIGDVQSYLRTRYSNKPAGYLSNAMDYAANGLQVKGIAGATIHGGSAGINSFMNVNPDPPSSVYPKAGQDDAPYSLSETQLRSAIYIPPDFNPATASTPVLFVPGTGAFGGMNFEANLAKVLRQDVSVGQAVWLNIPGAMLDDTQRNSEYIAYAMNYIRSLTGHSVSVLGWSQGGLDSQWVLKYWPSTRNSTRQLICVSPDFHGTVLANLIDIPADAGLAPYPQAVLQQEYNSKYISTLRRNGGDSAYVPTTTLYSALFDEIVQPQAGASASAFMRDARGVGVSNNEIQTVCGATPAGTFGTHESLLFNGLVVHLVMDALRNGGPADPERLNLGEVCQQAVYPTLDLVDVLETEALIPIAAVNIMQYIGSMMGSTMEPLVRAYARN